MSAEVKISCRDFDKQRDSIALKMLVRRRGSVRMYRFVLLLFKHRVLCSSAVV